MCACDMQNRIIIIFMNVLHNIPTAPIPPPLGQLRGNCTHCQFRGLGINLPQGYPIAYQATTSAVTISTLKRERERSYATISRGWGICALPSSPAPGICHSKQKILMPGVSAAGGGGGGGWEGGEWAQLEMTDVGFHCYFHSILENRIHVIHWRK